MYMIKRDNIQSNTIQHNNTGDKLFFPKKTELPQVGFEPTTLCSPECSRPSALPLSYRGSSDGRAQIYKYNTIQGKAKHLNNLYYTGYLYSV